MMEPLKWPRTGHKRLTARAYGNAVILVLQVETKSPNSPARHWRDAKVEDLTEGNAGLDALKVAA